MFGGVVSQRGGSYLPRGAVKILLVWSNGVAKIYIQERQILNRQKFGAQIDYY